MGQTTNEDAAPVPAQRMMSLPDDLATAITQALKSVSTVRWTREAQELSQRYRAPRGGTEPPLATGKSQVLGYAALVLPATYAQLRGAMAATAARIPNWQPISLLDLGSGPGTALWAAVAQWPSLQSLTAWEREPAFLSLGRELARSSRAAAIRTAHWEQIDLRHKLPEPKRYDLVVLGHVLNELSPDVQRMVVALAWQRTAGVLLIVEPGTSAAFPVVRAARDQLLAAGAQTIAPCAHDLPCPLQNDWCHFPQRLKRPDFQRRARGALSEWEDSKFSYAALAHFAPAAPIWGRVIREATSNKVYAEVKLSTRVGIMFNRAFKRDREMYRVVKHMAWGEALAEPLPAPVTTIEAERLPEERSESGEVG